jgi:hypothetical protein
MKLKVTGIFGLMLIVFFLGTLAFGFYLAFKASVIIGALSLFISPSAFVFGICGLFGTDLPQLIVEWFSKHS